MGKGFISFLLTVGACTWIYGKFQRYSGNNTQQSLTAVGVAGVLIFIVSFVVLSLIL
ncbi:hypothetical protein HYW35_02370 [Candidatus Saccharibacteria bacterium]|nr:hypothetical protein [Candidatus Saccharibacteria bacterium]